jgi:O-antigen/teichoic acid export membrane protein
VLSSVYLTKLAKASTNQQSLINSATAMTRHLLIIAALGYVCMIGFPEIIVNSLYGNNGFDNLIFLMPIFGIVMLIRIMGNSYGIVLTVNERQLVRTAGAGLSVIVSIVMNLILIPIYGLQGAIYASIITHVFLVSIYVLFARLQTRSLLIDRRSMFVIAIVVATGLVKFALFPESNMMTYTVAVSIASSIGIIGVTKPEFRVLMKHSQIFFKWQNI